MIVQKKSRLTGEALSSPTGVSALDFEKLMQENVMNPKRSFIWVEVKEKKAKPTKPEKKEVKKIEKKEDKKKVKNI